MIIFAIIKKTKKMKDEKLVADIETIVCERVGVDREHMLEKTKKGACVKARHLSIFILHSMFCLSITKMSERYGCSKRQVFKINKQMRDYIAYNSKYRTLYEEIVEDINRYCID